MKFISFPVSVPSRAFGSRGTPLYAGPSTWPPIGLISGRSNYNNLRHPLSSTRVQRKVAALSTALQALFLPSRDDRSNLQTAGM